MSDGVRLGVAARRGAFTLDVALDVAGGERVAVMGPNGAGKTTLLRCIAGLDRPQTGTVRIGTVPVFSTDERRDVPAHRRRAVLLGQHPSLFPHLSARDNVAFGVRAAGAGRSEAARVADEWLARVALGEYAGRRPDTLSGGQRQRVALARALAVRPAVLLLDEPFAALDPDAAASARSLTREQTAQTGTTVIAVTHELADAAALADRLVIVEHGAVTHDGALRDVLAEPSSAFVARLSGASVLTGEVRDGCWRSGPLVLPAPDAPRAPTGAGGRAARLTAIIPPGSARLTLPGARQDGRRGSGSETMTGRESSGAHETTVLRIEQTATGLRVWTADPALSVDLALDPPALALRPGDRVGWTVDAAQVRFLEA